MWTILNNHIYLFVYRIVAFDIRVNIYCLQPHYYRQSTAVVVVVAVVWVFDANVLKLQRASDHVSIATVTICQHAPTMDIAHLVSICDVLVRNRISAIRVKSFAIRVNVLKVYIKNIEFCL